MKTLLASLLATVLLGCASPAIAPSVPSASVAPSFATERQILEFADLRAQTWQLEIQVGDNKGSCSSVQIKPQILLTAAHCDVGALSVPGVGPAVKIRKDEVRDLMLVYVEKLTGPVAELGKQPGEDHPVVMVGFPLGLAEYITEGRVQGEILTPENFSTDASKYFTISAPGIFGNSGGPVYMKQDGKYKLVGICSAMAMAGYGSPVTHMIFAIRADIIKEFLAGS